MIRRASLSLLILQYPESGRTSCISGQSGQITVFGKLQYPQSGRTSCIAPGTHAAARFPGIAVPSIGSNLMHHVGVKSLRDLPCHCSTLNRVEPHASAPTSSRRRCSWYCSTLNRVEPHASSPTTSAYSPPIGIAANCITKDLTLTAGCIMSKVPQGTVLSQSGGSRSEVMHEFSKQAGAGATSRSSLSGGDRASKSGHPE